VRFLLIRQKGTELPERIVDPSAASPADADPRLGLGLACTGKEGIWIKRMCQVETWSSQPAEVNPSPNVLAEPSKPIARVTSLGRT
jgi:hypothetical protein